MEITTLYPVENKDTAAVRAALDRANIKASVRKGKGSCRYQVYITPRDDSSTNDVMGAIEELGFQLRFEMYGKVYVEKVMQ